MSELSIEKLKELLLEANQKQSEDLLDGISLRVTKQLEETSEDIKELKDRCLFLERKTRKNNVVIFGLDNVSNTDLAGATLLKLNGILGLNFSISDVSNVYKIGRSEKPPVIVEFVSY